MSYSIALVGDYNVDVTAHVAIPKALELAASTLQFDVEWNWLSTAALHDESGTLLSEFDGIWCVPASPYASMDGALGAIRHVREHSKPFLGTCGGYQHAVLEFARNVLGLAEADNAEVNPGAAMPLIGPLSCALVELSGDIEFADNSRLAEIYGQQAVTEKYHCSYGVAPEYVDIFEGSDLVFCGRDSDGAPRAIELRNHPFFVGTAYQPERAALSGKSHPLIEAFVLALTS